MKNAKLKNALKLTALFITLLAVWYVYLITIEQKLNTSAYTLQYKGAVSPVRIVAISDLHSKSPKRQDLAGVINALNPDVIFLVGDIVDDIEPIEGAAAFFESIKDICPVYYVTGNHEYWADDTYYILSHIQSYGITILQDTFVRLNIKGTPILLAGIDDPAKSTDDKSYNQFQSMKNNFNNISGYDDYKILLAHRPERIEQYKAYPFDLVVSGHTHGGQIRIPGLINGLFAPNQGFFPKYAGGIYPQEGLTLIVSRGLYNVAPLIPRLFNPPEIVVIDILNEGGSAYEGN